MRDAAEAWLEGRLAEVPEGLSPWLTGGEDEGSSGGKGHAPESNGRADEDLPEVAGALARRGLEALRRAAARPGSERESAFLLLAADAYLTWACEALLSEDDPTAGFEELIRRTASEGA